MTTTTEPPAVRLLRYADPTEVLGFVTLPGAAEVRVRFRRSNGPRQWRCDECGPHRFATCPHEVAVRDRIRAERQEDRADD